jgi:tetratricopeptide (TPR) repeat protein
MRQFRAITLAGWMVALALLGFNTAAALAAAPGKAPPAEVTGSDAQARDHFERGVGHFDKQEYREALEQFRKSLGLKKTRNAMGYAASCLKQLGQYDDALEQY